MGNITSDLCTLEHRGSQIETIMKQSKTFGLGKLWEHIILIANITKHI